MGKWRTKWQRSGVIEIEVMLASALLALLAGAFVGTLIYADQSLLMAGERQRAVMLASEGVEAVRNIRDSAWNELQYNQSAVQTTGGAWSFVGEGTDETLGDYTRTITFTDICRNGSDTITACPGTYTDAETRQVDVSIAWTTLLGVAQTVTETTILTNWASNLWNQTDWSGGAGQSIWSAADRYDTDDGNVNISTTGQVELVETGTACGTFDWPFDTAGNYTYNTSDIEVTGGVAQLIASAGDVSSITTPALDNYEYETAQGEEPSFLQISDDVFAVTYNDGSDDGFVETYTITDAGEITTTGIDILEFDTTNGEESKLFQVSDDTYGVAYRGPGEDGFLKTFTIDAAGNISTVVDTLEFDTTEGREPDVVRIGTSEYYAIAYRGSGADGFLATVRIGVTGDIGESVIDSVEYDAANGERPSIVNISGDIYGIAYQGAADDGFLVTVEIGSMGMITKGVVDSLEYDTGNGETPSVVNVSGSVYAVAYEGAGSDGFVATIDIATNGTVGNSVIDVLEFNTTQALQPDIEAVTGDVYAISYSGSGNDGFLTTVEIDSAGNITNTALDTLEFNTGLGFETDLFPLDSDTVGIAYRGPGNDGFVETLDIDGSGNITEVGVFEYNTTEGREPSVVNVSGDIWAIAYYGPGQDGFVATMDIDAAGTIIPATISNFEYDTTQGHRPNIINIAGSTFAIVSQGAGNDGFLDTITISSLGVVTPAVIDSFEFDTAFAETPVITPITGDEYLITYEGPGADGFMKTVTISSGGTITTPENDSFEFDTVNGEFPYVEAIDTDTFAVFYDGGGTDGFVQTVSIDGSGDIASLIIDQFEFDTTFAYEPHLVNVSGSMYAIAYEGDGDDGFLVTIDIASDGNIAAAVTDSFEYQTTFAEEPYLAYVSGESYAIAYEGPDNDGFVSIVNMDSAGNITTPLVDTFEFDAAQGQYPRVVVEDELLVIAYEGAGNDGYITTIDLTTVSEYPTDEPTINPASPQTVGSIDQWTSFTETATKNGGEIYYQLSDDSGTTWYYWNGSSWAVAGATDYNTATVVDTNIYAFPVASGSLMFRAFLESDGAQLVQLDNVQVSCATLQMELGQVSVDDGWTTVTLTNTYQNPVVVASRLDSTNTVPASTRVRNAVGNSFDVRLHNPSGSSLTADTVTYFVIEEGTWTHNTVQIEAYTHDTSTFGYKNNWTADAMTYNHTFSSAPFVMHQLMSNNDTGWVTTLVSDSGLRTSPPDTAGFWLGLNGAEVKTSHGSSETIGWIAMDITTGGTIDSPSIANYEIERTPDTVTGAGNGCTNRTLSNVYASTPLSLVFQQEMDGNDGSWGVQCNATLVQVGMHADEDQVTDSERNHTTETFGWIAFDTAFAYSSSGAGGGGGGGGTYETDAEFQSSAFDMSATGPAESIEWDEDVSACPSTCDIELQVRTAPDSTGSPGTWTDWYGATGSGTYFTEPNGSLIPTALNDNQWIQYRVEITSDGADTPVLEEIRIRYR